MVFFKKYLTAETFACAYWRRDCVIQKNAKLLKEKKYLCRNMAGLIRGALPSSSPFLQAWLCKSGAVIAKISWGCYTSHGVHEFVQDCGEELA